MTGFQDNTTLETYTQLKDDLIKFSQSIPILHKYESKYGGIEQLVLESGFMTKKSWIRLQHALLVPVSYFWKYDWHAGGHAYDQRLNKRSYRRLMYLFGIEEDEYESTGSVVENAARRLARLASQGNLQINQGQLFGVRQPASELLQTQQLEGDKEDPATASKIENFHGSDVVQQDTTQEHMESFRSSDVHKSSSWYSAPSRSPSSYSPTHTNPPSGQITTPNSALLGEFDTAMASDHDPGHKPGPGHPSTRIVQPSNLYPATVPPNSQPTIHNNYYSTSTAYNSYGPMSHNFGIVPGQYMAPDYQQLAQQWQQGLARQQQALNQYVGHMQPSNAANGQNGFQPSGQPMPQVQQPLADTQMANPYPYNTNPAHHYRQGQLSNSQTADQYNLNPAHQYEQRQSSHGQMAYQRTPNAFMQPYANQNLRNQSSQPPFQPQPRDQFRGQHTQPHRLSRGSFSPDSAVSNLPSMRNLRSTHNEHDRMGRSILSNGDAASNRQQAFSSRRAASYHGPQVEDCEESERGNAIVGMGGMSRN